MKFGVSLIIILYSSYSYACFSGIGYEENWNDSIRLLLISFIVSVIAAFIRYVRKVKRLYLPIIIVAISSTPPFLEMLRYGNGDCGDGLMQVAVWPVYVAGLVVVYEIARLVKGRLGAGNT